MTTFRILSDLHLEKPQRLAKFLKIDSKVSLRSPRNMILAGDITNRMNIHILQDLFKKYSYLDNIIYVLGNHEYLGYNGTYKDINKMDTVSMYKDYCSKFRNVSILENEELQINDVKIFGATLFCDHKNKMFMKENENTRKILQNFEKNSFDIVVTHYVPSYKLLPLSLQGKNILRIASDCDSLLDRTNYWIYGHTHKKQSTKIGNTWLLNHYDDFNDDSFKDLENSTNRLSIAL